MSINNLHRSPYLHPDRPIPNRSPIGIHHSYNGSWTSSQRTETQSREPALDGWDVTPSGFSPLDHSRVQGDGQGQGYVYGYGQGRGRGRDRRPVVGSWQRRHTRDWLDRQIYDDNPSDETPSEDNNTSPIVTIEQETHEKDENNENNDPYEDELSSKLEKVVIGPDGWPVYSSEPEEPKVFNEDKEPEEAKVESPPDLSPSTTAADSSSIEVVIDPLTADPPYTDDEEGEESVENGDDSSTARPSTPSPPPPPPPPTFNPAKHGRTYGGGHYSKDPSPNVMRVANPRKWGSSGPASVNEVTGSVKSGTVHTKSSSIPPMTPPHSPELQTRDLPSECPHLRKSLAPTYRGRLLKIEVVDGVKRYVDESSVFIGRLVKEIETEVTLFERFGQYGPVVSCFFPVAYRRNS